MENQNYSNIYSSNLPKKTKKSRENPLDRTDGFIPHSHYIRAKRNSFYKKLVYSALVGGSIAGLGALIYFGDFKGTERRTPKTPFPLNILRNPAGLEDIFR